MNDTVEEIFARMFAPNPIPPKVVELYDRTNLFVGRIDAMMRPSNLCVIAGLATILEAQDTTTVVTNLSPTRRDVPIDTAEPDADAPVPAPETPAEGQTGAESPTGNTSPAHGPTGPMDAPPKPDKNRRALSKTKMEKLTLPELIVHSKQMYGYKPKKNATKKILIAILGSKEPI